MQNRERFHRVMNFEPADRLPMVEWAGVSLAEYHVYLGLLREYCERVQESPHIQA